ncbi:hypothetical protein [Haloferula sp. A504]|uniref:hypothetical protein n=1 Tax=Haloferula sp. A504 TaxID=3373601 RepID=UPI0031C4EEB0|nr:hypothetical protein [Verrucomicrobiaceae bacterium E54]
MRLAKIILVALLVGIVGVVAVTFGLKIGGKPEPERSILTVHKSKSKALVLEGERSFQIHASDWGALEVALSIERHGSRITLAGNGRGLMEITRLSNLEIPLDEKGYWDAMLGVGDDRGGRVTAPEIARHHFPGIVWAKHFQGRYISGYILGFENGDVSGRLWYYYEKYYGDFSFQPNSQEQKPNAAIAADFLEVLDKSKIRLR